MKSPQRNSLPLSRFAIHTITTKPWPLEQAIDQYARAGFGGISIWRDTLEGRDLVKVRTQVREAGLKGVSLVRGGFLAQADQQKRKEAIEENRRCIDQAKALDLPGLVLVCGADPTISLEENRKIIQESLELLSEDAKAAGVRLGIEPLHPMYADTRSAINTLEQSNQIALAVNSSTGTQTIGSVVDVYHLWWDPNLSKEIAKAGENHMLQAFHVCDWRIPTRDFLWDRGLMGEGCIDIPGLRNQVEDAGFLGFIEVEIFSHEYWAMDQEEWLEKIQNACKHHV
jgi:sugar phosphate isomerase/epimerase